MKMLLSLLFAGLLLAAGCDPRTGTSKTDESDADRRAMQTLRDLGVTPHVMLQLVRDDLARKTGSVPPAIADAPVDAAPATATPAPAPATPAPVAAGAAAVAHVQPVTMAAAVAAPATVAVAASPAPADDAAAPAVPAQEALPPAAQVQVQTVQEFVQPLTPYGTWVDVSGYGRVWQPSVTIVDAGWRPYCHGGHWVSTDCGWYWQSDYSWGWAPFHYGRWCFVNGYRWVWMPDTVWSPAWVSWRRTDTHCGWAPLPPAARFQAGVGIAFGDDDRFDVRFGLTAASYTFVAATHFGERNLVSLALTGDRVDPIYRTSSFVARAAVWDDHDRRVHVRGPDTEWIGRASHHDFRPIRVAATPPPRPVHAEQYRVRMPGPDAVAPSSPTPVPAHSSYVRDIHTPLAPPAATVESPRSVRAFAPSAPTAPPTALVVAPERVAPAELPRREPAREPTTRTTPPTTPAPARELVPTPLPARPVAAAPSTPVTTLQPRGPVAPEKHAPATDTAPAGPAPGRHGIARGVPVSRETVTAPAEAAETVAASTTATGTPTRRGGRAFVRGDQRSDARDTERASERADERTDDRSAPPSRRERIWLPGG